VIVGVLDAGFYGLVPGDATDLYTPLLHGARQETPEGKTALSNNRFWGVQLIARRAPGVSHAQLLPVMATIFPTTWSAQRRTRNRTADSFGRGRTWVGFPA